eukprot:5186000-Alexandrium_andersonii.AAC.1
MAVFGTTRAALFCRGLRAKRPSDVRKRAACMETWPPGRVGHGVLAGRPEDASERASPVLPAQA